MAIIEVNNLGKKYYLGERMSQRSILDSLKTTAKMPYRLARALFTGETGQREAFWALKDVSFKVEEGEVLGIIGRNGAGKSTLLKILSRIVAPTEGEVILNGRVGSLLEVGTGFHPELTGRENIFMNGSLLGMSNAEINKHFDEIVEFSGVDKFLDTPVKFYSSGMYTRLAFSVAAHLRTEILIVDEVLAVGDTEFQKKCLNKMDSVAKSGRTILFVSHNMNAVRELCQRGMLLSAGKNIYTGSINACIDRYCSDSEPKSESMNRKILDNDVKLCSICSNNNNIESADFNCKDTIANQIEFECNKEIPDIHLSFSLRNARNELVFISEKQLDKSDIGGRQAYNLIIPPYLLTPGAYFCSIALLVPNSKIYDSLNDFYKINIHENDSPFKRYSGTNYGCVFADCKWEKH